MDLEPENIKTEYDQVPEESAQQGDEYLPQLQAELDSIDVSFTAAKNLLETEIARVRDGNSNSQQESIKYIEVHNTNPVKLTVIVKIPTKEHPKVNFVGKLLGPGGTSLKRLQQDSQTKMAIQGKGSMRDKEKEEELRNGSDPKYAHLKQDLHLKIDALAPSAEAYSRIASALRLVQPFMIPEMHDSVGNDKMSARGRGGGRGQARGDSYCGRDSYSAGGSYDDFGGREPYGEEEYYDGYGRGMKDQFSGYQPARQSSGWSSGNGYSSGGFGKSPRGRGSNRAHPYSRGGGRGRGARGSGF